LKPPNISHPSDVVKTSLTLPVTLRVVAVTRDGGVGDGVGVLPLAHNARRRARTHKAHARTHARTHLVARGLLYVVHSTDVYVSARPMADDTSRDATKPSSARCGKASSLGPSPSASPATTVRGSAICGEWGWRG
jgi:hypothetical protein